MKNKFEAIQARKARQRQKEAVELHEINKQLDDLRKNNFGHYMDESRDLRRQKRNLTR